MNGPIRPCLGDMRRRQCSGHGTADRSGLDCGAHKADRKYLIGTNTRVRRPAIHGWLGFGGLSFSAPRLRPTLSPRLQVRWDSDFPY